MYHLLPSLSDYIGRKNTKLPCLNWQTRKTPIKVNKYIHDKATGNLNIAIEHVEPIFEQCINLGKSQKLAPKKKHCCWWLTGVRNAAVASKDGPENKKLWPSAGLILGQRRRRWPRIIPALDQRFVFAGKPVDVSTWSRELFTDNVCRSDVWRKEVSSSQPTGTNCSLVK